MDTDEAPAPTITAPRRLTRSSSNRVLGGVCGGLAEHTGVDPLIFRICAVALALGGGTGALAYLLAWLLIPSADDERAETTNGAKVALVIVAVVFGLPLLFLLAIPLLIVTGLGVGGDGGFFLVPALVMVALLVALSRRDGGRLRAVADVGTGPATAPPSSPTGAVPARAAAPLPNPRPADHRLFILTCSVLLLVTGAFLVRRAVDPGAALDPGAIIASQLLVVAGGLLVGAWYGRSRGLIVLGGLLLLPAWLANAVHLDLAGGVGERIWTPASEAELEPRYELGLGNGILDLTGLDPLLEEHTVELRLSIGQLEIRLPDDVPVTVRSRVEVGEVDRSRGASAGTSTYNDDAAGERLTIDARVGVGQIVVGDGSQTFGEFGGFGDFDGFGPPGAGSNGNIESWAPATESELQTEYRVGGGRGTLDLRAITGLSTDRLVDIRVGSGDLRVLLPEAVTTTVDAEAGSGRVLPSEGLRTYEGRGSSGRLTLRVRVGSGTVTIERAS